MADDPAIHQCPRCERAFRDAYNLGRHLARKTTCAPILEPEDLPGELLEDPDLEKKKCRFCGRVFSSYTSMRRHVRNTCKIAPNAKNGDTGMEVLYEHTIRRQQAQIDHLTAMVEAQSAIMKQLVAQGGGGHNQNAGEVAIAGDANQVDNRKIVNINVFGKEGLDHVTIARIKAILDESLARPALPEAASAAVLKTAMLVYSDPGHPENLTCYLPNKKTNDVLVHASRNGTTAWEVQPASLVLPPMAQKSVDTLFDRQPYEDADEYGPLMKELAENEARYVAGHELRPVLVRNKDLLARALESLPVADRRAIGAGTETRLSQADT